MAGVNRAPRLFDLDPRIQRLLTLDTFKGDASSTDFIEEISAGLIEQTKEYSGKAMDVKSFIRTFENVFDKLAELRIQVQEQCEDLENACYKAETQHRKNVNDLAGSFDNVYRSYDTLESRVNEVGKTAIRIGEQLETLDRQRSRTSESRDILDYFMDFENGGSARLDDLRFNAGEEGQLKAAVILRRVNAIIKEVDMDSKTRGTIEKVCEEFERDMLEDFNRAVHDGDPRAMEHSAKVLFGFNGGTSCIQTYVNQHEFFISNRRMIEMSQIDILADYQQDISDPFISPPEVDTSLVKLYDEVRITARREAEIIIAVFPNPVIVMQVFLQRVFAQSIQNLVEQLLEQGENISHLAFLRTLASTHAETVRLVENLKSFCDNEMKLASSKDSSPNWNSSQSLSASIDRCMEDLFVPYTEGDRYMKREQQALYEIFGSIISSFLRTMQLRKKTTTKGQSKLTRALNQIANSTSSYNLAPAGSAGSNISSQRDSFDTTVLNGNSSVESNISSNKNNDGGGMGLIPMDQILKMLQVHAESVTRGVELTDPQERPQRISALFELLMDFIGSKYLDIAMDTLHEEIDTRAEPELRSFAVVKTVKDIIHLLQEHFEICILPLIAASTAVHRQTVARKNEFMTELESKANSLLQKEVDAITNWLSSSLSKQKRNDFRPKEEEVFMTLTTQPCTQCVDFVKRVQAAVSNAFTGKNRESILTEIGSVFHSILLEHFKKFYVSPAGGLLVTKDIAKYQEIFSSFGIPALNDRFEMLRQLGNIFVVKPEILPSILSKDFLARIDPKALHPYLRMREDFKSAKIDHLLGMTDNPTRPSAMTSDGSRSQRLSMYVSDHNVMKQMMNSHSKADFLAAFNM
ncbi:exocyst complex component Sec10-like protein [Umbelopsis sp. AD052]|nr:exocyst complex component Sec10-like protein [Umbelopsis sp. AD052]